MGTRGLLGFIIRGKRHGAYNHMDSYPEGLGRKIVDFILSLEPEEYATMAALVEKIIWVDEASPPSQELQDRYAKFTDLGVSESSPTDWYCLLRKTQMGEALWAIKNGELEHLVESIDFGEDGLFCEWSYFIDFENKKLETYERGVSRGEFSFADLNEVDFMASFETRPGKGCC